MLAALCFSVVLTSFLSLSILFIALLCRLQFIIVLMLCSFWPQPNFFFFSFSCSLSLILCSVRWCLFAVSSFTHCTYVWCMVKYRHELLCILQCAFQLNLILGGCRFFSSVCFCLADNSWDISSITRQYEVRDVLFLSFKINWQQGRSIISVYCLVLC